MNDDELTAEYRHLLANGHTLEELESLSFSDYYEVFKMAHQELEKLGVEHDRYHCAIASLGN